MYCFKCGAKVPDGAKFCPSCGAQLIDDTPAKEPAIPEEIKSEQSAAPDSKMSQVEEVSEDTKVQGTSEELPKKKSKVKSIIELVLGAVILVAFLLSATGVLDKQLSGKIGSYVMFFEDDGSYTIGDDDGNDIIAMTFGRGYNIEWTTLNDNVAHTGEYKCTSKDGEEYTFMVKESGLFYKEFMTIDGTEGDQFRYRYITMADGMQGTMFNDNYEGLMFDEQYSSEYTSADGLPEYYDGTGIAAYDSIIYNYSTLINWVNKETTISDWQSTDYVNAYAYNFSPEELGYYVMDLNGDGVEELVIFAQYIDTPLQIWTTYNNGSDAALLFYETSHDHILLGDGVIATFSGTNRTVNDSGIFDVWQIEYASTQCTIVGDDLSKYNQIEVPEDIIYQF